MNAPSVERRRHPRIRCDFPVRIRRVDSPVAEPSGSHQEFTTKACNASQGGICIESPQPINQSELFRLSIDLPGPDAKVTAFAEVVWTDTRGGGLHFLAIHEEQESHLRNYLLSSIGSRI